MTLSTRSLWTLPEGSSASWAASSSAPDELPLMPSPLLGVETARRNVVGGLGECSPGRLKDSLMSSAPLFTNVSERNSGQSVPDSDPLEGLGRCCSFLLAFVSNDWSAGHEIPGTPGPGWMSAEGCSARCWLPAWLGTGDGDSFMGGLLSVLPSCRLKRGLPRNRERRSRTPGRSRGDSVCINSKLSSSCRASSALSCLLAVSTSDAPDETSQCLPSSWGGSISPVTGGFSFSGGVGLISPSGICIDTGHKWASTERGNTCGDGRGERRTWVWVER